VIADSVIQGGYAGGTNIITTDPRLGTLGNYGGFTQTIPLPAGSSAIDAGHDSSCPATDQRGAARPQGSQCDIGAYEYEELTQVGPNYVVNTNEDHDDGLCDPFIDGLSDCSLRDAINAANGDNDASEITFNADYIITLAGNQLPAVTTTITIDGNGATNTILQANANPNIATNRVLEVTNTGNLTVNNLTIRNGRCNETCPAPIIGAGGGILNTGGTLTITNSTLSSNSATDGGGVANMSGALVVANSTFSANSVFDYGGGIYTSGVGIGTVTNSTFSGNSADTYGGGIFEGGNGTLTVTSSTLSGNVAYEGGAL
jgi:CSLREA domain-containing protein